MPLRHLRKMVGERLKILRRRLTTMSRMYAHEKPVHGHGCRVDCHSALPKDNALRILSLQQLLQCRNQTGLVIHPGKLIANVLVLRIFLMELFVNRQSVAI